MPRFFFNTHIGDELVADPEGEELRDLDRAWEVARAMIRELLKTEGAERGLLSAVLEVRARSCSSSPLPKRSSTCRTSPSQSTEWT